MIDVQQENQPLQINLHETDDTQYLAYGNRISHYRSDHEGSSIIFKPKQIPEFIKRFLTELPDYYE
eukprot:UN26697